MTLADMIQVAVSEARGDSRGAVAWLKGWLREDSCRFAWVIDSVFPRGTEPHVHTLDALADRAWAEADGDEERAWLLMLEQLDPAEFPDTARQARGELDRLTRATLRRVVAEARAWRRVHGEAR